MTRRTAAAAPALAPAAPAATLSTAAARRRDRDDRIPRDARALLAQFGERASSVKVWRWNADDSQYEYVRTIPATDFSEDRLQAKWGGGKYRGDILDGASRHVGSIPPFAIAGEPYPIRGVAPQVAQPAPESAAVSRLEAIVAGMAETVRGLADVVRVQVSGGGGSQSRLAEFREMAEMVKSLTPAQAAAGAAVSPVQAVRDMMDAAELLGMNRGGNGTTDWVAVAEKTVTPLVGVLSDQIALNRETMLRRRNPAAAAIAAAPVATVPAPGSIGAIVADMPAMARDYLASCAAQDKDPALYAETVLDALPGDVLDGDESRGVPPLALLLAADDAVAQLVAAVPVWAPHAEWIGKLVAAMRASLAESAAEASA